MATFQNITLDNVGNFGTSGNNWYWEFDSTDTANTTHTYTLRNTGNILGTDYKISYNWTTRKWFDTQVSGSTWYFDDTATATNLTARESSVNLQTIYIYSGTNQLGGSHSNPYYDSNYSAGPTVTPATYDVPNDTGGRTSLQNLFRIYDLNLIKFGHKGYQVSFQHEDAPSTFNVYVCYTNTNNDTVEDEYSVNITTSNSNKTVYLKKVQTYLPKAGTIDIKFSTQATLAGITNQTFLANTVMKSFTYVPNDLTVTFSPNVGTPGTTVTLSITGSDNTYVSTQEAYFIPPNWFEANVGTTTITKNNLGQFDYTNTFNVIEGTYNVTHPQGAQYNVASATYDANYVAPTTASNGGGKPDRYPIIMTNLFNRNRSLYSIGMTHKDTWDLFL